MHQTSSFQPKSALPDLPFAITIDTAIKCANSACSYTRSLQDDEPGHLSQTVALLDLDSAIPLVTFSDSKKVFIPKRKECFLQLHVTTVNDKFVYFGVS